MNRLSIFAQWLVVAGLAGFLAYVLVRPVPQPDYAPGLWHGWDGVTVLSYAGIGRTTTPAYPSVRQLEAHLTALRDAGYRTVRPADVRAFLDKRAPLPDKALLLIFEGGRKEALIRATPVLQRTGFTAVMAVPTSVMSQWGGFYLKRSDIRKAVSLPQWEVGSMGHLALAAVPGGAGDERFLARRERIGGRAESDDAFRARLEGDYARSSELLSEAAGRPALLYLYPYGEAGQTPGSDPLSEAVNREAVTRHFGLAFLGGAAAFNGPDGDPWSLTRLRVPGDWAPERLLAELDAERPRRAPLDSLGSSLQWSFEREAGLSDGRLRLAPNAAAWLRGTEGWSDAEISADLRADGKGASSLYARYAGLRSWLRVAVDAGGVRVQERIGDRLTTLHREAAAADAAPAHSVRLRLRNNRAWLWVDGKPSAENLPLAPTTRRGRVGFGSERAASEVTAFSARPLPSRWLLSNSVRLVPEAARDAVQAVLPNWFRAGEPIDLAQTAQQDLLHAAVAGIRTLPLLTGGQALDAEAARAWAQSIDSELGRANLRPLVPSLAVEGPAVPLSAELRNLGYRVTHVLTAAEAQESGRALALENPEDPLVVNESGEPARQALLWLQRVVPATRLALREPEPSPLAPGLVTARTANED